MNDRGIIRINFGSVSTDTLPVFTHGYKLLNCLVASNRRIKVLTGFETIDGILGINPAESNSTVDSFQMSTTHHAEAMNYGAQIYDKSVSIQHHRMDHLEYLVLDSMHHLWINHSAQLIHVVPAMDFDDEWGELLALGPGLIPLLAPRNIWLLHASAITTPKGVVIFCGASGAGKSTLANALDKLSEGCYRCADDVVALSVRGHGIYNLPCFPQPKLQTSQQPVDRKSEPVYKIFFLTPYEETCSEACNENEVKAIPAGNAEIAIRLVNHIMGSNIPDQSMQRDMLKFSGNVVNNVSCMICNYPHQPDSVQSIIDLIEENS